MNKLVYFQAFLVWLVYSLGTKILFIKSIVWGNQLLVYGLIGIVSGGFGILFLYLFSHENFFKFAKLIEKKEIKKERKWLNFFSHAGKSITVLMIGLLAGPLFAALSARILLSAAKYKYWFVFIVSAASSVFWLFMARSGIWLLRIN